MTRYEKVYALMSKDLWANCPEYPRDDWKYEVINDDTQLGYWEWALAKAEESDFEKPKK